MNHQIIGQSGNLTWGCLRFPSLEPEDTAFPYFEIRAMRAGPRLAIIAGMHPNEVSSMEAALRLKDAFADHLECGSVTILPLLNMPGLYRRSEFVCPIDGKNINFCFPGRADGSYSERLAYLLVNQWSVGAEVVVDLHGGDLREDVAKFVMCQMTGNDIFDAHTRRLARCFDADIVVEFEANQTVNAGRATNELPRLGRYAVMSEAGCNGILSEECVAFHTGGVLNIARELGLIAGPHVSGNRARRVLRRFEKITAPVEGRFYREVEVNEQVSLGQRLAVIKDLYGASIAEICAPEEGRVVMVMNHAIVTAGEWVFSIGPVERT
jgi:predicted deacylase